MVKYFFVIVILLGVLNQMKAQPVPSIQWKTVDEFNLLFEKNPKKILLKVYAQDCHYCQDMDQKVLSDKDIATYINQTFYAIKLDAFDKTDINLRGHVYTSKDGLNPLASFLLKGKMKFPTLIFIDDKLNMINYSEGYNTIEMIDKTVHYFGDDAYKTVPWQMFEKNFKATKKTQPLRNTKINR